MAHNMGYYKVQIGGTDPDKWQSVYASSAASAAASEVWARVAAPGATGRVYVAVQSDEDGYPSGAPRVVLGFDYRCGVCHE